jgi:hypothetical protein
MGVDGTGEGLCPVADFGISGVELTGSATRELVNSKMDFRETDCEDGSEWNWLKIVSNGGLWY